MATLLDRILNNVDPSENGNPNTARIPVHDFFSFLRLYRLDTTLGLNQAQWKTQATSMFDLSAGQKNDLAEWVDGLDSGTDLHLYEAALILGDTARQDGSGLAMTKAQVKTVLGLTSD